MAETTEISWAHSTFNPWIGCTKVSPGCDNCYAKTLMDDRYGRVKWGAGQARSRTSASNWQQPRRWNRYAQERGEPWRVFCASLADVFDNEVDEDWRADLWNLILATPALTWMLLTKRIGNVPHVRWPANVWIGATIVNQEEYDRDIDKLRAVDAHVRFISAEPLLGPIILRRDKPVDWLIVGGESGKGARPMEPDWASSLRDQCADHGIPFHFKQWGEWAPYDRGRTGLEAGSLPMQRFGKALAGHLLDGAEHRAFPPKD